MSSIFVFFVSLTFISEANLLPSSCIGLEDGVHELQLVESDQLPSINSACSNEYVILDFTKDKNIQEYFISFKNWYPAFVGPSNDDNVDWNDWFIPANENSQFLISPDCNSCDEDAIYQYQGTNTTYFMTGSLFGCSWNRYSMQHCDYYYDETISRKSCHSCEDKYAPKALDVYDQDINADDFDNTGNCPELIKASTEISATCGGRTLKPSLGIKGTNCVCFKPNNNDEIHYYKQNKPNDENDNKKDYNDDNSNTINNIDTNNLPTIYLYQKDFDNGPYRIKKPGNYILKENIEFNFNSGDVNDPFADDAWWPTSDQDDSYPGANGQQGYPWWLGFFAGITVETSYVTLDLNNYEIKMNEIFYHLQRWFTCIELSTQYFVPGEGLTGNFGGNPIYASNVIIKNGKIGLSSHHSIHGNNNNNIILKNLDLYQFETHSIQLNGFNTVEITNVEIHDNSKKVYFTSHFGRMKALLPRLKQLLLSNDNGQDIYFKNRDEPTTISDVISELELQMQLVWEYVIFNKEPKIGEDISKEDWEEALYTFYNEDGIFYGSSVHGIFLNTFGANTVKYKDFVSLKSNNVKLNNVKVYNIELKAQEAIILAEYDSTRYLDFYQAPYDPIMIFGEDFLFNEFDYQNPPLMSELPPYKGNALIDILSLYSYYASTWNDIMGGRAIHHFTLDNKRSGFNIISHEDNKISLTCAVDTMLHSAKGLHGIRIDSSDNIELENIEIYNLYQYSNLGYEICGPYEHAFNGNPPVLNGYSGVNLLGLSIIGTTNTYLNNININNLISNYGKSYGISLWDNNKDIKLNGYININNIYAGNKLEKKII